MCSMKHYIMSFYLRFYEFSSNNVFSKTREFLLIFPFFILHFAIVYFDFNKFLLFFLLLDSRNKYLCCFIRNALMRLSLTLKFHLCGLGIGMLVMKLRWMIFAGS